MGAHRNLDDKQKARRKYGAVLGILSGHISKTGSQPKHDLKFKSKPQAAVREHTRTGGTAHAQLHNLTNTSSAGRSPLIDRITRDGHHQPEIGGPQTPPRERGTVTRKRGRTDEDEPESSSKKARVELDNKHAHTSSNERKKPIPPVGKNRHATPTKNASVTPAATRLSEEQKRAARAERFKTPEHAHPPVDHGHRLTQKKPPRTPLHGVKDSDPGLKLKNSTQTNIDDRISQKAETRNIYGALATPKVDGPKDRNTLRTTSSPPLLDIGNTDRLTVNGPDRREGHPTEADTSELTPASPTHLPSPVSNTEDSPSTKRPRSDDENSQGMVTKKPRTHVDGACSKSSEQVLKERRTKVEEEFTPQRPRPQAKVQKPKVIIDDHRTAPVEPNPHCALKFYDYADDSVPVLYSDSIHHDKDMAQLLNNPTIFLKEDALELYERELTSKDYGREQVPKIGSSRVIDDCDLYLRNSLIYVATDRGLLLAADYMKAIGVPDSQPVRFNGRKPAWAKLALAKHHLRRVELHYAPLLAIQKYMGFIEIVPGSFVMVFERITQATAGGQVVDLAYGKRLADGVKGFFSYAATCPPNYGKEELEEEDVDSVPDPDMVDWTKYDYARLAEIAQKAHAKSGAIEEVLDAPADSSDTQKDATLPVPQAVEVPDTTLVTSKAEMISAEHILSVAGGPMVISPQREDFNDVETTGEHDIHESVHENEPNTEPDEPVQSELADDKIVEDSKAVLDEKDTSGSTNQVGNKDELINGVDTREGENPEAMGALVEVEQTKTVESRVVPKATIANEQQINQWDRSVEDEVDYSDDPL